MLNWLRNIIDKRVTAAFEKQQAAEHVSVFESLEDDPDLGSQRGLDVEAPRYFAPIIALLPPFDLQRYLTLWLEDSLAHAIVKAFVLLVISEIEVVADNPELKNYVEEFNRRIDLQTSLYRIVLDRAIYGFSPNEIVGNRGTLTQSTEIRGLFRLDPRSILAERTPAGKFRLFHQRLLSTLPPATTNSIINFPFIELDSDTVLFIHSPSPRTVYGQSLYQSILSRLEQRNELIQAAVTAAKNHANNKIHWHYQLDPQRPEDKDEIKNQRRQMRAQIKQGDEAGSKNIYSAGTGTYTTEIIGPSTVPDITRQIDLLTADIIVACGLSPSALGFSMGSGVTTSAASTKMTVNNIVTEQQTIAAELNEKLYSLLPFIESVPKGSFYIRFKAPTLETEQEKYQARASLLNNVGLELRMGSVKFAEAASELGRLAWADEKQGEKWIQGPPANVNPRDPNGGQQQRKAIDSANDGKEPSNNPSGEKGNDTETNE